MTQTATLLTPTGTIRVEMPAPDAPVAGRVRWGSVDAFPTPAYWHFQVLSRRLNGMPPAYRLGRTLVEEAAACLLGGHGIPATVGIAAFELLRSRGALNSTTSQPNFEALLREPIDVGGRAVRYRFAAQKARYLAQALPALQNVPDFKTGKALRDWLMQLPGIGPKTASWIARNWLDADDVAILDIHIVRVGQAMGLFPQGLTVERHYLQLEALFLEFSHAINVRPAELDAVVWYEMASSPASARFLIKSLNSTTAPAPAGSSQEANEELELELTV